MSHGYRYLKMLTGVYAAVDNWATGCDSDPDPVRLFAVIEWDVFPGWWKRRRSGVEEGGGRRCLC